MRRSYGGVLGAFGTIRGKMTAVVVVSVVIAMGLAAYAMVLAPGLALQSARPLVEAGGAGTTESFRVLLLADERAVRGSAAVTGLEDSLSAAAAGNRRAVRSVRREDLEVIATPGVSGVATLSVAGAVLTASGVDPSPAQVGLARTAMAEGRAVYAAPALVGKTALAAMAVPIRRTGQPKAVGAQLAVFDLTALARSVAERVGGQPFASQSPVLVTPRGTVLYDLNGQAIGQPLRNRQVLTALRAGHGSGPIYVGEFYAPIAGARVLGVFDPVPGVGYDLYVLTGERVPPVNSTLPLFLALAAVAMGAVALRLGGYRLTRPIGEAVAAARSYGRGDLSARIPPQRDAEFRDLAGAFNDAVTARSESFRVEELLAGAQEQLAQAQSEEAVLRMVGEGTCSILGARLAVVLTPDAEETLVPRAVCGEAADFAAGMRVPTRPQFPESAFPCAAVYREGRFLSLKVDPPYPEGVDFSPMRERAASFGLARLMSFPLLYQGRTLGAMNCFLGPGEEASLAAREAAEALAMTATAALHGIALREETMLAMAASLEARDDETQEHALRVALYAERLAREMGIDDPEELQRLRWGALLHDVGKMGLSDAVLRKPGPLSRDEWQEARRHPETGYRLVGRLEFLGEAREIIRCHHERWDGQGYPRGLRGEDIPLPARIFSVVDSFDAITSDRPYRAARGFEEAWEELDRGAGGQFDPRVVQAFRRVDPAQWEELRRQAAGGWRRRTEAAG
ncbi:MAG: HD domain-containing protein [Thermaerobacter sp.]|nr:HD domain-containing protein [Thermaerobacter sp.]